MLKKVRVGSAIYIELYTVNIHQHMYEMDSTHKCVMYLSIYAYKKAAFTVQLSKNQFILQQYDPLSTYISWR